MSGLAKQTNRTKDLAKYDPQKGVKKIAVAEMAVKHYAKIKDRDKLNKAIRDQMEEIATFVLWWKTQGPGANRGRPKKDDRSVIFSEQADQVATELGTNVKQISRWSKTYNDPDKFETHYERACNKYDQILFLATMAHVGQNTGEHEWYTPADYLEAARRVLGAIDLDPASTLAANEKVKAAQIYTAGDNGLARPWAGRVWLNPPYSQPLIEQFAEKLAGHAAAHEIDAAIALVNNATDTAWFRTLADVAAAICFKTGRVKFWGPDQAEGTPLQGQAFLYFGDEIDLFLREFRPFGFVLVRPE